MIREYVNKGHRYDVICDMLSTHHDIKMSCGTLKARLKDLGLRRSSSDARTMGPNYLWHVDGYDKLKPFGMAISGCIDGFPAESCGSNVDLQKTTLKL